MRPIRLRQQPGMDVKTHCQAVWCHCLGYAPCYGSSATSHIEHSQTGTQELRETSVRGSQRACVEDRRSAMRHMGTLPRLVSRQ